MLKLVPPRLRWLCPSTLIATLVVTLATTHASRQTTTPAPAPEQPAGATRVADISEERLRLHVKALVALGPRMGGTPSGDAAAAYVAVQMRQGGLDARVQEDAPVLAYWADAWEVSLEAPHRRLESAWPYVGSPAIHPARTAPLVGVANVLSGSPQAWSGKVVYSPKAIAPGEPGAVAILTSAPHDPTRYVDSARIFEVPSTAAGVPVFALSYREGLVVEQAAREGRPVSVSLNARSRTAPPRTVIGTLPGARSERYYLVTAHGDSDSGGPGADDNASGVAVVLELARVLVAATRAGSAPLPFSIRFAVWGAEYHSARDYIAREGKSLTNCLGVINFDQVGTGAEREAVYAEGNDVPWNATLLTAIASVGRAHRGGAEGYWPEFVTTPTQGGTDAYAFLPRAYKGAGWTSLEIPATTIYTAAWDQTARLPQTPGWEGNEGSGGTVIVDYSRYYHSGGDMPENTTEREPQNLVRAARLAALSILELARSTDTTSPGKPRGAR